jgi:ribosomal protein S12 methylthiotransferase
MNRRGTVEKYLKLIKTIRKRLSRAVIRSTFLLGFPGETEKDFAALLDFQEKANLDWLGCFTYSKEEGTASFSMKNHVPKKTASKRRQIIEEKQTAITEKNMERFAGKKLEVLIEDQIDSAFPEQSTHSERCNLSPKSDETIWLGRLYCQAPEVDGATLVVNSKPDKNLQTGELVPCKVIARRGFDLLAQVISAS